MRIVRLALIQEYDVGAIGVTEYAASTAASSIASDKVTSRGSRSPTPCARLGMLMESTYGGVASIAKGGVVTTRVLGTPVTRAPASVAVSVTRYAGKLTAGTVQSTVYAPFQSRPEKIVPFPTAGGEVTPPRAGWSPA